MTRARITIDRDFTIGDVPRRLFGSFVEHMGRCVYSGIYEPGHPTATPEGYRQDVLDLTKELGATVVRYPGGGGGTSSPATTGRTASARSRTGPAASTARGTPSRPTRSACTSSWAGRRPRASR
ncbi:hypothetical protein ABXZ31_02377 [Clavibacter nebraskensis]